MLEQTISVLSRQTAVAFVSLGLLVGVSCSKKQAPGAPPPAPVRVAAAEIAAVPVEMRAIGTVEPSASVSLKPRVTGMVTRVQFQEGQDVAEGDVLFTLDRKPFEVALREAEANVGRAVAEAASAEAEARRYAGLAEAGVGSRQDAEQRLAAAKALRAAVAAMQAAVAARRLDLEYTTIKAPIGGRTGAVLVREGNLVRANETDLVVINKIEPILVSFTIPEKELRSLQQYMASGELPITAAPPEDPNAKGDRGTITFVDNAIDPTTGTVRVKGTFQNADKRLWPGQFVQTQVTLATRADALVVPAMAVQRGQVGPYVFVVGQDLVAHMRPVTPGDRAEGQRVIITNGLAAGEQVITDGHLRVVPGAKVSIQPGNAPAADAGAAGPEGRP
jgi:multidrug efflux system membrane fusion protein